MEPSFLRQIIFKSLLIYSDYYYYGLDLDFVGFKWDSGIKTTISNMISKFSDKFKLNYGNAIYYDFNPGTIKPSNSDSGINFDQLDKKYAFEPSLYVSATRSF
jgi:hypothetical protein